MAIKSPKMLYDLACQNKFGLGAFNVYSLESMLAVMEAAEAQSAPVILQVSMGARGYVRHLKAFVDTLRRFSEEYAAPMFLQHDHCATAEACKEALDAGLQAVMFDGSHLDYEENIRQTARVAAYAHDRGAWVEAELGRLPGFEDLVFSESAVFTPPEKIADFIGRSGCDALAVAVGTSHGGVSGDGYLPLRVDLLDEIVTACPGFPFVLHGGASLPPALICACNAQGAQVEYLRNCSEEDIALAVRHGIRKVNMDVDNFLSFTTAARAHLREKPAVYDPRKYLGKGMKAFQVEVEHKLRDVVKGAGQARFLEGACPEHSNQERTEQCDPLNLSEPCH